MARMYPERIPERIKLTHGHEAEVELYQVLQDELSPHYRVFCWVNLMRSNAAIRQTELDFVVLDADRGFVVIEVKGGGVSRKADGTWTSTDRSGAVHEIDDPYVQARQAQHEIYGQLKKRAGGKDRFFSGTYGVVFPDIAAPAIPPAPDSTGLNTIYSEDIGHIGKRLDVILAEVAKTGPAPGNEGSRCFVECFGHTFEIPMTLGSHIRNEKRTIGKMTERQYEILDALDSLPRVIVQGSAGTGKTMLALEKARRLAAGGARTLLTCYNLLLADYLSQSAANIDGLTVSSIDTLFCEWARRAGLDAVHPAESGQHNLPADYFTCVLPDLFVRALETLPERFDAIVVDEGQDFCAAERIALEFALSDREAPIVYVFEDKAQSLFVDREGWPHDGFHIESLTGNVRNTRGIHQFLGHLEKTHTRQAFGPEGPAPELIAVNNDTEMQRELSRCLHHIIEDNGVRASDIAVLAASRREISRVVEDGMIGKFRTKNTADGPADAVLVDSISRFKGLERDVVILTALRGADYVRSQALLYVGASRASHRLYVIETPQVLARLRGE